MFWAAAITLVVKRYSFVQNVNTTKRNYPSTWKRTSSSAGYVTTEATTFAAL
jgi:hypothetical protein